MPRKPIEHPSTHTYVYRVRRAQLKDAAAEAATHFEPGVPPERLIWDVFITQERPESDLAPYIWGTVS